MACPNRTHEIIIGQVVTSSGGPRLRSMYVEERMFGASEMIADATISFEEMKVRNLKDELLMRGVSRSGLKAALQRRLHGLIVQAAIAAQEEEGWEGEEGDGEESQEGEAQDGEEGEEGRLEADEATLAATPTPAATPPADTPPAVAAPAPQHPPP